MILLGSAIAKAINHCAPNRVAVAYLGIDWRRFIKNPQGLEAIVISPTLGTNPNAVDDLVKELEWKRVFFLDELHAKIYLGKNSAVIGSANLTFNGLSGEVLIECCTKLNNQNEVDSLEKALDSILTAAKNKYPNDDSKITRLAKLRMDWNLAHSHGIISQNTKPSPSIDEFELNGSNDFYVSWWEGEQEYSDVMSNFKSLIKLDTSVLPEDKVERGKFILLWEKYNDRVAPENALKWLHIDEIVHQGFIEKPYTTCVFQRNRLAPEACLIMDYAL